VDDLQYPSMQDIYDELDEIEGWQKDKLIDFCRAARRHYGRPTLEQQEQESLDAERAAWQARRAAHEAKTRTHANMYLVAQKHIEYIL
jgi:hypothetical protein